MEYRTRKQIIIGIIYFLLFGLVGAGVYYLFVYQPPTCEDGIKNRDEEEIDCGGSFCQLCQRLEDISVLWAEAVWTEGNFYDVVAKIKNPNPNFGTANLKYSFELKNQSGQVISQRNGTTFILPNATKYVVETNFETQEKIKEVNLKIENVKKEDWLKLQDYQSPDLFVMNKEFSVTREPQYLAQASGVVKNATSFGFDKVNVNVVLFGDGLKVIGVSRTEIRTLTAGEGRYFIVKWFSPLSEESKSFDMQAETNLFFDDNYMKIHGTPEGL